MHTKSRSNSHYHQEVQSMNSILAGQLLKAVISITSSLGPFLLSHHRVVAYVRLDYFMMFIILCSQSDCFNRIYPLPV